MLPAERGIGLRCPACGRDLLSVHDRYCDACGRMIHIDGDDQLLVARVVGSAAVGLVGEIDMATEALLRDHLDAAAVQDPGGVKLDVSGVSFIDARGVSVLVHLSRQLAHAGAEVVLVDPSRSVRRVLEATHISPLFRIEEGRNLDFDE